MSLRSAALETWSGRLFLWPGRALYVGYAADTFMHAHHALQLCVSLDASFRLRGSAQARWRAHDVALVEPDRPHQLDGRGAQLALVYLDPESDGGRTLLAPGRPRAFVLHSRANLESLRDRLRSCSTRDEAVGAVDQLMRSVDPHPVSHRSADARVARLLERIRLHPELHVSAADAARSVALSSHRFQHVFRDSTGIPLRRYLLWSRLVAAVERVAGGGTLTDAAHAAGFSDSAHLSRTFRRMFGLAPSALKKDSQFVQAHHGRAG